MVMLTVGINRIRTLFKEDIYKCQGGTGTTTVINSDTGLETADSNTLLTPTIITTDKSIQVTHTIASTIGEGESYSEQETQLNSGDTSANRIVHHPLTKGANDEFVYITNFYFDSV